MDHILYQIFNIILSEYILRKYGENIDNPSVRIYVNKIENRMAFKNKTGYHPELLTPKTMKLLESTEGKITKKKKKNGENVPHLKITEVVLIQCDIVTIDYQQDSRVLYTFFPKKWIGIISYFQCRISGHWSMFHRTK